MSSFNFGNLAGLFGSGPNPFAGFAPFYQPIENCLTSDRAQFPFLPTSVYGNKKVAGYEEAMRTITVDSVLSKINGIVN
jgi:hypothetical protein